MDEPSTSAQPSTSVQPSTREIPKMIVPDKVLQQLKCSECHNYLSVGPVKMTAANQTLCGRCVQNHPNQETLKKSMYDYIAHGLIFKCIYHFQGCRALVPYVKIYGESHDELHEDNCMYKDQSHELDCSDCSFKAKTGTELIYHLEQHNKKVMMNSNFIYRLGDRFDAYLVKNDFLFQVKIDYRKHTFGIRVSPYVANKDLESFTLHIRTGNSKIEYLIINSKNFNQMNNVNVKSLMKFFIKCHKVICKIDIIRHSSIEEDLFKAQIELSNVKRNCKEYAAVQAGIVKLLNVYYPALLKCSRCRSESKNMYHCVRGHSLCCDSQCDIPCKQPRTNLTVTNVFEQITNLPCEWKGCKQILNFNEFMRHKICCEYRVYTCPVDNCSFSGNIILFKRHFYAHLVDNIVIKMENTVAPYSGSFNTSPDCYWLLNKESFEIVKVQWDSNYATISTNEPVLAYNRYFFYIDTNIGKNYSCRLSENKVRVTKHGSNPIKFFE